VSGRRHRRERARRLAWAGWGLLVVLLCANLATALSDKGDTPQGLLTPEFLQVAGFWGPLAVAVVMAPAGWFWSIRAYAHNQRSSLLWARRGFVFTLAAAAALAFACLDAELFSRAWLLVLASSALGGQALFFGMLAFREYRRAQAGEMHRRSHERAAPSAAQDVAR
jgi:hypothetical protein